MKAGAPGSAGRGPRFTGCLGRISSGRHCTITSGQANSPSIADHPESSMQFQYGVDEIPPQPASSATR